jgi:hypothetical protein
VVERRLIVFVIAIAASVAACFPEVPVNEDVLDVSDSVQPDTHDSVEGDTGEGKDSELEAADSLAQPDSDLGDTSVLDTSAADTGVPVSCTPGCANGGVCRPGGVCDCLGTGFVGPTCEEAISTCPASTHECIPAVAAPWVGPLALSAERTACGGLFPVEVGTFYDGLEVPESSCTCSCGDPTVTCPESFALGSYSDSLCENVDSGGPALPLGGCYGHGILFNSAALEANGPETLCGDGAVLASVPATAWTTTELACGVGAEPGRCMSDGEFCAPRPVLSFSGASVCVVARGDLTCPEGYPERLQRSAGILDGRQCATACNCSPIAGRCRATGTRFDRADCVASGTSEEFTLDSDEAPRCLANGETWKGVRVDSVAVLDGGTCDPESLVLTGEVQTADPHTLCCRP